MTSLLIHKLYKIQREINDCKQTYETTLANTKTYYSGQVARLYESLKRNALLENTYFEIEHLHRQTQFNLYKIHNANIGLQFAINNILDAAYHKANDTRNKAKVCIDFSYIFEDHLPTYHLRPQVINTEGLRRHTYHAQPKKLPYSNSRQYKEYQDSNEEPITEIGLPESASNTVAQIHGDKYGNIIIDTNRPIGTIPPTPPVCYYAWASKNPKYSGHSKLPTSRKFSLKTSDNQISYRTRNIPLLEEYTVWSPVDKLIINLPRFSDKDLAIIDPSTVIIAGRQPPYTLEHMFEITLLVNRMRLKHAVCNNNQIIIPAPAVIVEIYRCMKQTGPIYRTPLLKHFHDKDMETRDTSRDTIKVNGQYVDLLEHHYENNPLYQEDTQDIEMESASNLTQQEQLPNASMPSTSTSMSRQTYPGRPNRYKQMWADGTIQKRPKRNEGTQHQHTPQETQHTNQEQAYIQEYTDPSTYQVQQQGGITYLEQRNYQHNYYDYQQYPQQHYPQQQHTTYQQEHYYHTQPEHQHDQQTYGYTYQQHMQPSVYYHTQNTPHPHQDTQEYRETTATPTHWQQTHTLQTEPLPPPLPPPYPGSQETTPTKDNSTP